MMVSWARSWGKWLVLVEEGEGEEEELRVFLPPCFCFVDMTLVKKQKKAESKRLSLSLNLPLPTAVSVPARSGATPSRTGSGRGDWGKEPEAGRWSRWRCRFQRRQQCRRPRRRTHSLSSSATLHYRDKCHWQLAAARAAAFASSYEQKRAHAEAGQSALARGFFAKQKVRRASFFFRCSFHSRRSPSRFPDFAPLALALLSFHYLSFSLSLSLFASTNHGSDASSQQAACAARPPPPGREERFDSACAGRETGKARGSEKKNECHHCRRRCPRLFRLVALTVHSFSPSFLNSSGQTDGSSSVQVRRKELQQSRRSSKDASPSRSVSSSSFGGQCRGEEAMRWRLKRLFLSLSFQRDALWRWRRQQHSIICCISVACPLWNRAMKRLGSSLQRRLQSFLSLPLSSETISS